MLFRPSINQEIINELDKTVFTHYLFHINLDPEDCLFEIKFKQNEKNYLKISYDNQDDLYFTTEAPGLYENSPQDYECSSLEDARKRIRDWLVRLQQDFKSETPKYDELENFRNKIMEHFDQNQKSESQINEFFSEEEKKDLNEKLSQMQEKIDLLYKEKDANRRQISQMHDQIKKIKEGIEILDKRTWLSATVNRVIDIYKEVKAAKNEVSVLFNDFDKMLPNPASSEKRNNEPPNP